VKASALDYPTAGAFNILIVILCERHPEAAIELADHLDRCAADPAGYSMPNAIPIRRALAADLRQEVAR
jgi:hypothetical protein